MPLEPLSIEGEDSKQRVVALIKRLTSHIVARDIPETVLQELEQPLLQMDQVLETCPPDDRKSSPQKAASYEGRLELQKLRSLYTPVSGRCNALSPDVRYFSDKEKGTASAVVKYGNAFEGGPGLVHGGLVAALFDELFGVIENKADRVSMTGGLNIRYHKPTPLNTELRYDAWTERTEGRKAFLKAELKLGEQVLVSADATFIRLDVGRESFKQLAELARKE